MEEIKSFQVRLPEDLVEKMDAEASRVGGSRNALIQRVFVERYEKEELARRELNLARTQHVAKTA